MGDHGVSGSGNSLDSGGIELIKYTLDRVQELFLQNKEIVRIVDHPADPGKNIVAQTLLAVDGGYDPTGLSVADFDSANGCAAQIQSNDGV